MATVKERLEFIFSTVGNDKAARAFKEVGGSASKMGAEVETGVGKVTTKFGEFANKAAPYAAAATAVGVAVFGAAEKFKNLALQSGKFADATGLSVDQASRWIEVAGDMGIEAGTVEGAIGKMSKAVAASPEKFAKLGVEIRKTADGTVDMNATFLSAISVVNGIQDPIRRAQVASQLFGKGWQSMSELVAAGSDKLAESLGAVSDAKVISADELKKAKEYREAMDRLQDAFEDLALALGKSVVPALQEVADKVAAIVEAAGPLLKIGGALDWGKVAPSEGDVGKLGQAALTMNAAADAFRNQAYAAREAGIAWADARVEDTLLQQADAAETTAGTFGGLTDAYIGNASGATGAKVRARLLADALMEVADAAAKSAVKAGEMDAAWKALTAGFDVLNLRDTLLADLEDVEAKGKAAFEAAKKGAADADKKMREYQAGLRGIVSDLATYEDDLGGLPLDKITEIKAAIDAGSFEEAERLIKVLTRNRSMTLSIITRGGVGYEQGTGAAQNRASGGPAAGTVLAGEHGPELIQLPKGSYVYTASQTQSLMRGGGDGGGTMVVVNVAGSVVTERQLVDSVHEGLLRKGKRVPLGLN